MIMPRGLNLQKSSLHFFEIVDLQADVVQAGVHLHLAERGALLEKSQIVESVGDRDIALRGAAQLLGSEKAMVKVDEFRRLFGEIGDVAKGGHGSLLGME